MREDARYISSATSQSRASSQTYTKCNCVTDCSCERESERVSERASRGKPPCIPSLIHNSYLHKFINDGIIERVKNEEESNLRPVRWSRFESHEGRSCQEQVLIAESESGSCKKRAVTQWAFGLPFLALFKALCWVLALSTPHMHSPAESRAGCTGFDRAVKCHRPCLLSSHQYIWLFGVFFFFPFLSKTTLKKHVTPTARNLLHKICLTASLTVRT